MKRSFSPWTVTGSLISRASLGQLLSDDSTWPHRFTLYKTFSLPVIFLGLKLNYSHIVSLSALQSFWKADCKSPAPVPAGSWASLTCPYILFPLSSAVRILSAGVRTLLAGRHSGVTPGSPAAIYLCLFTLWNWPHPISLEIPQSAAECLSARLLAVAVVYPNMLEAQRASEWVLICEVPIVFRQWWGHQGHEMENRSVKPHFSQVSKQLVSPGSVRADIISDVKHKFGEKLVSERWAFWNWGQTERFIVSFAWRATLASR